MRSNQPRGIFINPYIWYLHGCKIPTGCDGDLLHRVDRLISRFSRWQNSKDPALPGRVLVHERSCAGCTAYSTTVRADLPRSPRAGGEEMARRNHASDQCEGSHSCEHSAEQPEKQ